ncbi:alpha/beta fold hydrolase [Streptomyces sp. NBC_00996]|uniref:alpha/beta fold hydrolase n=1 Tax=Streptomyces sp. NBC_00996 TaxID=2903710 RepID=UPI00386EE860
MSYAGSPEQRNPQTSGGDWGPTLPYWRHRVIVPDLRGHGRSPKPAEGSGARDFAADLAELLQRRSGRGRTTNSANGSGG